MNESTPRFLISRLPLRSMRWLVLCATAASAASAHPPHEAPPPHRIAANTPPAKRPSAATNQVSITIEGQFRVIRANGIPDHVTGPFPNRNNPNRVAPQQYAFKVPAHPQIAPQVTLLGMHPFGVALNGVVFDPGAAEWWNHDPHSGWQYEPMHLEGRLGADDSNAHVQPTGAYHYHAIPTALLNRLTGGKARMALVGWAADGFPIYGPLCPSNAHDTNSPLKRMKSSYQLKKGSRTGGPRGQHDGTFVADYEFVKGAGDLDECNGRSGPTPEFPAGTYYYVLTDDFPFIPRLFRGTPDSSFFRRPRGLGPPGGGRGFPPPDRRGAPREHVWSEERSAAPRRHGE